MSWTKVVRGDIYHYGTIGIFTVSSTVTHSVYTDHARLRWCIDNISTRAHTEWIYRPAIWRLVCHLIVRRREQFLVQRIITVLHNIYIRPFVLNSKSHCKWLLLHRNSRSVKHLHSISWTVSKSQHKCICPVRTKLAAHKVLYMHINLVIRELVIPNKKTFKHHISAKFYDVTPHIFYDSCKHIGAYMWLIYVGDGWVCPISDKCVHHLGTSSRAIFYDSVELSIGKCSGTTLTKLHVAVWIKFGFAIP